MFTSLHHTTSYYLECEVQQWIKNCVIKIPDDYFLKISCPSIYDNFLWSFIPIFSSNSFFPFFSLSHSFNFYSVLGEIIIEENNIKFYLSTNKLKFHLSKIKRDLNSCIHGNSGSKLFISEGKLHIVVVLKLLFNNACFFCREQKRNDF